MSLSSQLVGPVLKAAVEVICDDRRSHGGFSVLDPVASAGHREVIEDVGDVAPVGPFQHFLREARAGVCGSRGLSDSPMSEQLVVK